MRDYDPAFGVRESLGDLAGLGGFKPADEQPAPKPFFDLVGQAEGTDKGRGYNETLGYGKFTGGPVELTGMTVGQVLDLQKGMLSNPENNLNSSAVGRYQVVGRTLADAVQNGVVKPDDKFNEATQQKVAGFLAQRRGSDPAALRNEWAALKNVPDEQITSAYNAQFGAAQQPQRAVYDGAPPPVSQRAYDGSPPPVQPASDMAARSFTGYAQQKQAEQSNPANMVALTNQGAVRNLPIVEPLQAGIASAVEQVYGPGYQAKVYSGGQPKPGEGRRVGSTRHDEGNAADVYIYDPDGKRVTGDGLAPLARHWVANNMGGVGLEMKGGGIHLDIHKDRAPFWSYGKLTPAQQAALEEGMAARGQQPQASAYASNDPAPRSETMPAAFGRALGGVAVRSPMAERIMASAEQPGRNAAPEGPPVQVASAGSAVPTRNTSRPPPTAGQPPMAYREDLTRGPDSGALAFLEMNAGGGPTGGLGGLGGFMSQPTAPAAAGPQAASQGPPQASQQPPPQNIDAFLESRIPNVRPNPLGFFGPPAVANYQAAQSRAGQIGFAKMLISRGVDPDMAVSMSATPENRAMFAQQQERDERRTERAEDRTDRRLDREENRELRKQQFDFTKENSRSEPFKILRDMGVGPDHPDFKRLYGNLAGLTPDGLKQIRTSLQPTYGVDKDGNPIMLQTNDRGEAVQTALPPGVKIAKDPMRVETATGTVLIDPVTRQAITTIPKNVAEGERQKEVGAAQGKAEATAPAAVQTANNALKTIEDIRKHPGRDDWGAQGATAAWPLISGGIPGRPGRGFVNLVEQAKGQSFLQAFESLKGAGQITEVEGAKATQAIARLDRAQSKSDFDAALSDLEGVIKIGKERAEKNIRVPWNDKPPEAPSAAAAPATEPSVAAPAPNVPISTPSIAPALQFRYNPATGKMEPVQ